jgi:hypothetical protein
MTTGNCLCGVVRYEVDGPFSFMGQCHCSMCRKAHGSLFVTWAAAPVEGFRWISGEQDIERYASSASGHRSFCRHCGSVTPIFTAQSVIVPAGNLEGDPGVRPQMHMFAASKASWFDITDDLPQYAEYPPEFGMAGVARRAPAALPGVTGSSCLCGGMAWEVEGPPSMMFHCHCSRCRRARSAAFATNAFYRLSQFRWIRGEEMAGSYRPAEAQRFTQVFCRRCGSKGPRLVPESDAVVLPAGAMDGPPGRAVDAHIFVASKAPWDEITDTLPQFADRPTRR